MLTTEERSLEAEITSLENALRREGMRITVPRRRLLTALVGTRRLVTAQELYRVLEQAVGEATVYRLLNTLFHLGKARRYVTGGGEVAYLYCGSTHHHHAICLDCGGVEEIACQPSCLPEAVNHFDVLKHEMDLFGRCQECQKGLSEASP